LPISKLLAVSPFTENLLLFVKKINLRNEWYENKNNIFHRFFLSCVEGKRQHCSR
jgi:hypothetical protein